MYWYYALGQEQKGPLEEAELRQLLAAGTVDRQTLVWNETLPTWMPLAQTALAPAPVEPPSLPPAPPAPATKVAPSDIAPDGTRGGHTFTPETSPRLNLSHGQHPFAAGARGPYSAGRVGTQETVQFTGQAGEYFGIWIVNVVLTVLTLGIYAAWAKVRKRRYFYEHTLVAGQPFTYTGQAVSLLLGNLLLGGLWAALLAASLYTMEAVAATLALFPLVMPWLLYQAARYHAQHTRYRNIPFRFEGTRGQSYVVNFALLLLLPITAGLAWPYVHFRRKDYRLGRLSYGEARVRFQGEPGRFFNYGVRALGLAILCGVGVTVWTALFGGVMFGAEGETTGPMWALVGGMILYVLGTMAVPLYYYTRTQAYVLSSLEVSGLAQLSCDLRVREVLWLEVTNLLAIIATLGLAIPWAAIRRARYRNSRLHVSFIGDLDRVTAREQESATVAGERGWSIAL